MNKLHKLRPYDRNRGAETRYTIRETYCGLRGWRAPMMLFEYITDTDERFEVQQKPTCKQCLKAMRGRK